VTQLKINDVCSTCQDNVYNNQLLAQDFVICSIIENYSAAISYCSF
jgi:hypothetical protein